MTERQIEKWNERARLERDAEPLTPSAGVGRLEEFQELGIVPDHGHRVGESPRGAE